jgi:hypothetical protein
MVMNRELDTPAALLEVPIEEDWHGLRNRPEHDDEENNLSHCLGSPPGSQSLCSFSRPVHFFR